MKKIYVGVMDCSTIISISQVILPVNTEINFFC